MSDKRDEVREDRFTWNPGDLRIVSVGDGPPLWKVLEERKRQQAEDRKPARRGNRPGEEYEKFGERLW